MRDLWLEHRVLFGRWVARLRRERLSVLALLAQPMVWLVLFGHLFTKMAVPGGNYLRFMTAGAVVMTTFNACLAGGAELLFDRESGFLVRMLASPASRVSIVTSRFAYLAALTGTQGLIILVAAWVMGVRYASGIGGIAACLAIGALFGAGITALSVALAFSLRSHSQFFPITGFASLPLTFASTALVPLALMPGWMRAVARLNPMTYAIDSLRALIMTGWQFTALTGTAVTLLVFDVCCVAAATVALRRGMRLRPAGWAARWLGGPLVCAAPFNHARPKRHRRYGKCLGYTCFGRLERFSRPKCPVMPAWVREVVATVPVDDPFRVHHMRCWPGVRCRAGAGGRPLGLAFGSCRPGAAEAPGSGPAAGRRAAVPQAALRPEGRPRTLRGTGPVVSGGASRHLGLLSLPACQAACASRNPASTSAGVFQPSVLRGRPFSSSATACRC